jgi:hypothetical protein
MSRTLARRLPLVLGAALALSIASPLSAYVIILKDGSRIVAKEKPSIEGDKLVFVTKIGTVQSVPAAEYDQKRTEDENKLIAGGDALVLNAPGGKTTLQPISGKRPNLSQYIKDHKETNLVLKEQPKGLTRVSTAGPAEKSGGEKTAGESPLDPTTSDTFVRALEASGIKGPRLTAVSHGVRVQAVADSEQQVFAAIGAVARGLKETRAAGRSVDKAEVWLLTTTGLSAGRFDVSPEDADALLNGKVGVAKYFMANVIF